MEDNKTDLALPADGREELRAIAELAIHTSYSKSGDGDLYVFRADHARADLFSACTPARILSLLDELSVARTLLEGARADYRLAASMFEGAHQDRMHLLGQAPPASPASAPVAPPVTPKQIEEIKDILLWPVTEDDARAARDMLQSLHFDLSMNQDGALAAPVAQAQTQGVAPEVIQLLNEMRPKHGAVGSRDVDVTAQQKRIDAVIVMLTTPPAAAPAPELTDGDILQIAAEAGIKVRTGGGAIQLARAIERHLKGGAK